MLPQKQCSSRLVWKNEKEPVSREALWQPLWITQVNAVFWRGCLMVRSRSPAEHFVIKSLFYCRLAEENWKKKMERNGWLFWSIANSGKAFLKSQLISVLKYSGFSKVPVIKERSRAEQVCYEYTWIIFNGLTVRGICRITPLVIVLWRRCSLRSEMNGGWA